MIGLAELPEQIRVRGAGQVRPLPVPVTGRGAPTREGGPAPELEFIFRTLLEMRMDMEELRREFEEYRRTAPRVTGGVELPWPYPYPPSLVEPLPVGESIAVRDAEAPVRSIERAQDNGDDSDLSDEGVIVYRPGMRMDDIERAAIIPSLEQVGGKRRRAAEELGIGERTLYRKIKEYGIPL